jgi:hypothetical protein
MQNYSNTAERVKAFYFLPNYIAKLTGWTQPSGKGYRYTWCPLCQAKETRRSVHKFWLNRNVCGCFKPKCALHGHHDVINLHAVLNKLTNNQALNDLAKNMPVKGR